MIKQKTERLRIYNNISLYAFLMFALWVMAYKIKCCLISYLFTALLNQ